LLPNCFRPPFGRDVIADRNALSSLAAASAKPRCVVADDRYPLWHCIQTLLAILGRPMMLGAGHAY
jgi:hypothetical protein